MKNLIKLICIIVLALSLQSCATYSISTIGHETVQEDQTVNQLWFNFERDWRYQVGYRPYNMNHHYSWYHNTYSYNYYWNYMWNNSWYNGYQNPWNYNNYWGYNSYNHWGYHHPHTGGWLGNVYGNYSYGYTYGRRGSSISTRTPLLYSNSNSSSLLLYSEGSTFNSRTPLPNITASPITKPRVTTKPTTTVRPVKPTVTTRPIVTVKPQATRPVYQKPTRVIRYTPSSSSRPNSNSRPNIRVTPNKPSVPKTTTNSSRSKRKDN